MSGDASIGNSHPPPRAESDGAGSTNASAQRRTHGAGPEPEAGAWRLAEPVAIWFRITQSLSAEDVDLARLTLSPDERARCDQFVFERDRRDFAAAHALLRDVLSRYGWLSPAEWTFTAEAGGKPHLADPSELQFNIAHTRGLVACALSLSGPIGVDVKSIVYDRDVESIAERYFAPAELADLRAFPELDAALRILHRIVDLKGGLSQSVGIWPAAAPRRNCVSILRRFGNPGDVGWRSHRRRLALWPVCAAIRLPPGGRFPRQ